MCIELYFSLQIILDVFDGFGCGLGGYDGLMCGKWNARVGRYCYPVESGKEGCGVVDAEFGMGDKVLEHAYDKNESITAVCWK